MSKRDQLIVSQPAAPEDRLTAPPEAVPRRRPETLTLGDCWRFFLRQRTPPLIGAAIVAAVVLRVVLGHVDWRDAVVAAGTVALMPLVEWLIHVYLLHSKPIRLGGREHDLLATREHRAHHQAPRSWAAC